MKFLVFPLFFLGLIGSALGQKASIKSNPDETARPKLVVGIVVDQMRYDFLYRYRNRYGKGGFNRMLREGYSFANCQYSYFPTKTGPGHASIYTGTTPAVHGISGNDWYETKENRFLYCTQDDTANGIGTTGKAGKMSARNLQTYTVGDQIRLASNFKGKSFGISMKDRGSILPAGHSANAAFWFETESGNFISSSWYKNLNGKLPGWLEAFNKKGYAKSYKDSVWKPLLPMSQYEASSTDNNIWEKSILKTKPPVFPYRLSEDGTSDYNIVFNSPFGNDLTLLAATELLKSEGLGKDADTDFLSVSFSCTDVVGHDFGPYGIETEDTYLRLDRNLEAFFKTLDAEIGEGQYLCFLTADHGILEVPAFLRSHKLPSDLFKSRQIADSLRAFSQRTFGTANLISSFINEQVFLNETEIEKLKLNRPMVIQTLIEWLEKQTYVRMAFPLEGARPFPEPPFLSKYEAGFYKGRSGHIQLILAPGILESGSDKGTSHGSPYSYDSHVPCLWMGWKIKSGETMNPIQIQDIAPTLTSLLHIMEPNGCTGKPQTIPLKP